MWNGQVKKDEIDRKCSTNGEKKNACRLVGKPEGKRPLVKPRHRWVDNSKVDLGQIGRGARDWIDPPQDRDRWRTLMNTVMNFLVS
jgi:hypothetical protein